MKDFKIDRENKTFVFNDGEVIPIPKDKINQILRSKVAKQSKKETYEKWNQYHKRLPIGETAHTLLGSTSENYLGNPVDTGINYLISGIKSFSSGEGQEGMGYVDRVLDHFYAMQEGRKEALEKIEKKNPITSTIGKGLGIGLELATLRKLPASVALPVMGAGASETSFLEPGEKTKEVGKEAITGAILDKFFGSVSKIAGHRGTQRGIKNLISDIESKNAAEIEKASQATIADKLRFSTESIERETEINKLAQFQEAENRAFLKNNDVSLNEISNSLGKQTLSNEIFGVEEFINKAIDTSAHAATSAGNYVSKFLRSIFKGDKKGKINSDSLNRGIKALDESIIKNEGEIKQLLTDYKSFLNQTLPDRLISNYTFEKWMPKIIKGILPLENKLTQTLNFSSPSNDVLFQRLGKNYPQNFNNAVNQTISEVINGFKDNFHQLNSNLIQKEISNSIKNLPEYKKMRDLVDSLYPSAQKAHIEQVIPEYKRLKNSIEKYPEILAEKISENVRKHNIDIVNDYLIKGSEFQKSIQKAPISPNILPEPMPIKPAQTFQPNLQNVPTMPQPQGIYEKLANGLENFSNMGIKEGGQTIQQNIPGIALSKLAGLPIAKIAAGAATFGTGANILTNPNVGGQILRKGLEQGARFLSAIDQLAQKYPSYHNGIIENPQERRSLTKEIENISDIPIEQKAVYQSKINRGIPLQNRL